MQDYTTIAQRIAEARRRGCKVKSVFSGAIYDPDNMPFYDPVHDADCKSGGVTIVEPKVPPTRVRCWHHTSLRFFVAYSSPEGGGYYDYERQQHRRTSNEFERLNAGIYQGYEELTPAAALDLLKGWPEGRENLLQYFRDHPPLPPEPPTLAPCPKCGSNCKVRDFDTNLVICMGGLCDYGVSPNFVRLTDHPVRTDRNAEIMALFRELNERLGKLLNQ